MIQSDGLGRSSSSQNRTSDLPGSIKRHLCTDELLDFSDALKKNDGIITARIVAGVLPSSAFVRWPALLAGNADRPMLITGNVGTHGVRGGRSMKLRFAPVLAGAILSGCGTATVSQVGGSFPQHPVHTVAMMSGGG